MENMALNESLKEINSNEGSLKFSKDCENLYKTIFKIGLGGIIYLGVRSFVGPELDVYSKEITNALQAFDTTGAMITSIFGFTGGLSYGVSYLARKSDERDLNKLKNGLKERGISESELEKLSENYKFERGHI
jgi:hypothetical protein